MSETVINYEQVTTIRKFKEEESKIYLWKPHVCKKWFSKGREEGFCMLHWYTMDWERIDERVLDSDMFRVGDKKIYHLPKILVTLSNNSGYTKYFKTNEEMETHVRMLMKKIPNNVTIDD